MKTAARIKLECQVNGETRTLEAWPMERLLDVLREAGLTGTKEGCGEGECGACSVFIDGELVNSCLIPFAQVDGARIETVESLARGEELSQIQKSFLECGGAQCGICTPGMLMASAKLLERCPKPTEAQIREGLAGNLCRCTGYKKIFESVQHAAEMGTP